MLADVVEFNANADVRLGKHDSSAGLKIIRRSKNLYEDPLAHGKRIGHVEEASIQTDFCGAGVNAEAAAVHFANFGARNERIAGTAAIFLFLRACARLVRQGDT